MIYWKDGEDEFYDQLKKLGKEFESAYGYKVEEWALGSANPYKDMTERLLKFLDYENEGTLLILYYGGHGGITKDRQHTWLW